MAIGAFLLLAAGAALSAIGILNNQLASATGGAALIVAGLTAAVLAVLRRWITDTSAERRRQLDAARASEDERTRYIAAHAALEVERERIRRDAEVITRQAAARLTAERSTLRDQFESERAKLIRDTFETAARMVRDGLLDPPHERDPGRVIDFPRAPHPANDRGLSRS